MQHKRLPTLRASTIASRCERGAPRPRCWKSEDGEARNRRRASLHQIRGELARSGEACFGSELLLWRLPYRLQRLRGRQHPRGSHRSGFPRTGRARCLRHLVVQPAAACRARPQAIRQFLHPGSARSLRMPDDGCGYSTSPAISGFPLTWRSCTGCRTATRRSGSVPARISIAVSPCCVRSPS